VPTPGVFINSRARVSLRAMTRSRFSEALNSRRNVTRVASSAAAIIARVG